jgi:hypothetical protein
VKPPEINGGFFVPLFQTVFMARKKTSPRKRSHEKVTDTNWAKGCSGAVMKQDKSMMRMPVSIRMYKQ